jgi:hypothetical protein
MLTKEQVDLCKSTISPKAFYLLVSDALAKKQALSVVRMGDGEHRLWEQSAHGGNSATVLSPDGPGWLANMGMEGMTNGELRKRMEASARECTYFAPSISGITDPGYWCYDIGPSRKQYVDGFFVNDWTEEMKADLFKQAGHVLLIHKNAHLADSMQLRVQANLGVKVSWVPLTDWREAEGVMRKAGLIGAPLVLFSGGPACKFIGPRIAANSRLEPKVVLDLGNTANSWTFEKLPADRLKAEAFHAQWAAANPEKRFF